MRALSASDSEDFPLTLGYVTAPLFATAICEKCQTKVVYSVKSTLRESTDVQGWKRASRIEAQPLSNLADVVQKGDEEYGVDVSIVSKPGIVGQNLLKYLIWSK